jgi:hypothetical protein
MLILRNKKSIVSNIFTKKLHNEIISLRKSLIIAEYGTDESIEIDKLHVDKIYLSLICRLTLKG